MADPVIVKFSGKHESGRLILGVGLAAETIRQMANGTPIEFSMESVGLPFSADVVIMYRETKEELADWLRPTISPQTVVRVNNTQEETEPVADILKDFEGKPQ
jgi:hypothetical protein